MYASPRMLIAMTSAFHSKAERLNSAMKANQSPKLLAECATKSVRKYVLPSAARSAAPGVARTGACSVAASSALGPGALRGVFLVGCIVPRPPRFPGSRYRNGSRIPMVVCCKRAAAV